MDIFLKNTSSQYPPPLTTALVHLTLLLCSPLQKENTAMQALI